MGQAPQFHLGTMELCLDILSDDGGVSPVVDNRIRRVNVGTPGDTPKEVGCLFHPASHFVLLGFGLSLLTGAWLAGMTGRDHLASARAVADSTQCNQRAAHPEVCVRGGRARGGTASAAAAAAASAAVQ